MAAEPPRSTCLSSSWFCMSVFWTAVFSGVSSVVSDSSLEAQVLHTHPLQAPSLGLSSVQTSTHFLLGTQREALRIPIIDQNP